MGAPMPKRTVRPTGKCAVCQHPERIRIELTKAQGASVRAIAKKYSINFYAVHRHWKVHVTNERKASLLMGPVRRAALAARVSEESESILDHLKAVRAGLYSLYDAAITAGDFNGAAMLAGRLHEGLREMARLTGQLAQSPLISNTTNIFLLPAFAEVQNLLVKTLAAHPAARTAVIAAFREMEQRATVPVAQPFAREPLLIEHEAEAASV